VIQGLLLLCRSSSVIFQPMRSRDVHSEQGLDRVSIAWENGRLGHYKLTVAKTMGRRLPQEYQSVLRSLLLTSICSFIAALSRCVRVIVLVKSSTSAPKSLFETIKSSRYAISTGKLRLEVDRIRSMETIVARVLITSSFMVSSKCSRYSIFRPEGDFRRRRS
jgi:hypothetical protein